MKMTVSGKASDSLTWMRACQSTDWPWSWVSQAEAPCMGSLDHDKLGSALHICHTKDLLCLCIDHPEREKHR